MVAVRLGLRSGSLSSSQIQSMISSSFISTTKRISPFSVPPDCDWASPLSRPCCSTSPGWPWPWPAPCCELGSARRKRECSRNFTGTITVRFLLSPVIRSSPERISGSVFLTASRTFWLCRSQSRAPLEKRSYQGVSAAILIMTDCLFPFLSLLLRQECRYVIERFARAVRVVAVLVDQPLLDHRDLLAGLVVGPGARGHPAPHVAALLEEVLLHRVVQRRVAVEGEFLAALVRAHRLPHHLLAEGELAGLGDADLLLHVAQEALVGLPLLAGDRVLDGAAVERRLDLVEVLVQQPLGFLLERHEQRLVHVLLHPAVVEVLAHRHQVVDPLALLLAIDAHVGLDRVLERDQHIHGGQALRARLDDGVRERVDHEARRHAGEAFLRVLGADLLHLRLRHALDVLACVEAHFLRLLVLAFALDEPREHREHRRGVQRVRVEVHLAERLGGGGELLVDARLFAERKG